MMAGNMFFDDWFLELPPDEQEVHEYDCPRCGYKLEEIRQVENNNITSRIMGCESCGYTEIWQNNVEFECIQEGVAASEL